MGREEREGKTRKRGREEREERVSIKFMYFCPVPFKDIWPNMTRPWKLTLNTRLTNLTHKNKQIKLNWFNVKAKRRILTCWHDRCVSACRCAARSRRAAAPSGTGRRSRRASAAARTARTRSTAPPAAPAGPALRRTVLRSTAPAGNLYTDYTHQLPASCLRAFSDSYTIIHNNKYNKYK